MPGDDLVVGADYSDKRPIEFLGRKAQSVVKAAVGGVLSTLYNFIFNNSFSPKSIVF